MKIKKYGFFIRICRTRLKSDAGTPMKRNDAELRMSGLGLLKDYRIADVQAEKADGYNIFSFAFRYHINNAEFEEKPSSKAICLWLNPCFLADSKKISRTRLI